MRPMVGFMFAPWVGSEVVVGVSGTSLALLGAGRECRDDTEGNQEGDEEGDGRQGLSHGGIPAAP
jgi:hypothetical protein